MTDNLPALTMKDGVAYADSRNVAAVFGKAHSVVIRAYEDIAEGLNKIVNTPWFLEVREKHPQNGESYRHVEMTREGFTLLVVGFTGAKALAFKVAYILRFNEMEAALRTRPTLPDFSNPAIAARAWADEHEAKLLVTLERDTARGGEAWDDRQKLRPK